MMITLVLCTAITVLAAHGTPTENDLPRPEVASTDVSPVSAEDDIPVRTYVCVVIASL